MNSKVISFTLVFFFLVANTHYAYATLGTPKISPSSASLDLGQQISFNSTWSGGAPPYSASMYSSTTSKCNESSTLVQTIPDLPSSPAAFDSISPISSALYCVSVTDNSSTTKLSAKGTITVNPALTALPAPTVSAASLDANQKETITGVLPSAGTPKYYWQWLISVEGGEYANSTVCVANHGSTSNANSTENCIIDAGKLTSGNSYTFELEVSDSAYTPEYQISPASQTINVFPGLAGGSPTPSSPTVDLGQSITLSANSSGGTPPMLYQWYNGTTAANCKAGQTLLGTSSSQVVSPIQTKSKKVYYCYTVIDSATSSETEQSSTFNVLISTPLVVGSLTSNSPELDSGQPILLTANPSGGTTPYSYSWYGDNSVLACPNSATCTAYPTVGTNYSVAITDASAGNQTLIRPAYYAPVYALPTISAPATALAVDAGQTLTIWSSTTNQGSGNDIYQWYSGTPGGAHSIIPGATSTSYLPSTNSTGTSSYFVTDTDSNGGIGTSNPVSLTVYSVPSVSVQPSPVTIDSGQIATLTSSVSSGTGTYAWQWYDSSGQISGATGSGTIATYQTAYGDDGIYATFTDTGSSATPYITANSNNASVTKVDAPTASLAATSQLDIGQTTQLSLMISNGIGPFSISWSSSFGSDLSTCPTSEASNGIYSCTVTPNTLGTDTYAASVTDSGPSAGPFAIAPEATAATKVNSDPTVTGLTPSNSTLDIGQYVTYNALVLGGSGNFDADLVDASSGNVVESLAGQADGIITFPQFQPNSSDTYNAIITDQTPTPYVFASGYNSIAVNKMPEMSAASNASALNPYQSAQLYGSASGGTLPYASYQWLIELPGSLAYNAIPGATSNSFTFNSELMTIGGTYNFVLQGTDSASTPYVFNSLPASVVVNETFPTPILEVSVTANVVDDQDGSQFGYWALDNFTRRISIWRTGLNSYYINYVDNGTSFIPKGASTPGSSKMIQPFNGTATMYGEQNFTLNGTLSSSNSIAFPMSTSNAFIGTYDAGGSAANIVGNDAPSSQSSEQYYMDNYFTSISNQQQPQNWGYAYTYDGSPSGVQVWVDSASIPNLTSGNIVTSGSNAISITGLTIPSNMIYTIPSTKANALLTLSSNSLGSITANIMVANVTGNYSSTPTPSSSLQTFSKLVVLDINVSSSNPTSLTETVTITYGASVSASSLVPYILNSTSADWDEIANFTINSTAQTISFNIPSDPVVALFSSVTQPQPSSASAAGSGNSGGGIVNSGAGSATAPSPTIARVSNGFSVSDIASLDTFGITLGESINSVENFITPTSAGLTINGATHTLQLDAPVQIGGNATANAFAELTNVSWGPSQPTVTVLFYSVSTLPKTTNPTTSTTIPTTTVPSTSVPTATVTPQQPSANDTNSTLSGTSANSPSGGLGPAAIAVVIAIAMAVAYYGYTNRRRRR